MSKYNKEELWDKLFMMMPNIFFRKEVWLEMEIDYEYNFLNESELLIYALISSEQYSLFAKGHYSINRIVKLMNLYPNTVNKKHVRECLLNLVDRGFINLYADNDRGKVICLDDLKPADTFYAGENVDIAFNRGYTKVFYDEFCTILSIKEVDTMKLFNVYLHIVSRMFEGKTGAKIFYANILDIVNETGYDPKTVMKYVRILCEENVLYGATVHTNKTSKNFISRKRHAGAVESILEEKYGPESDTKQYVTGLQWIGQKRKEVC